MGVLTYNIEKRVKRLGLATASLADFVLGSGNSCHDPSFLIENATVSPYCVDPVLGTVVLAELPSRINLADAPFIYETQFAFALRIHTIPIDEFCSLAGRATSGARPILLHSTGRCGSTLLARALGDVSNVTTLSEPDIFTQLATAGPLPDATRPHFEALYAACVNFFLHTRVGTVVFKLRSIAIEHARYLATALPASRSIFLYRNAVAVARSYARLTGLSLSTWQLNEGQRRAWSKFAPVVSQLDGPLDGYDLMAALWAGPVLRYIELQPAGIWRGAVSYEEMLSHPTLVAEAILRDVRPRSEPVRLSSDRFRQHSQAGSHLAPDLITINRDLEIELVSPDFAERISQSLRRIDTRLRADIKLPGGLLG